MEGIRSMKKIFLLVLFFPWLSLQAQDFSCGIKRALPSRVLNEDRTYWVNLPTSYNHPNFGPQEYPVIYVLDGKSNFLHMVGLMIFMSGGKSSTSKSPKSSSSASTPATAFGI